MPDFVEWLFSGVYAMLMLKISLNHLTGLYP